MPWDGSGNYIRTDGVRTGADVFAEARDAQVNVNAPDHDIHDEGFATALENCITRDGQNSPIGNLPMNSKKHTGVADATAATEYAAYGQLLALATQYIGAASVGGTATAITLTPTPAITSLSTGITAFRFFSESDCGGPTTLAVSGLAAVTLRRADGTEFASGDFSSGREIIAVYNGAHFRTNILPPVEAGALPGPVRLARRRDHRGGNPGWD